MAINKWINGKFGGRMWALIFSCTKHESRRTKISAPRPPPLLDHSGMCDLPRLGIELMLGATGTQSLNHWATRKSRNKCVQLKRSCMSQ